MAGSNTLRFDVIGDASSAARAFRQTADGAALAARGAKQLSDSLAIQSRSAQASSAATLALAKSDDILRDAELELSAAAGEASKQLKQQGRTAEETAVKTRLASDAAKSGAGSLGLLASPMGAAIAAGAALSPVLLTTGVGLAGLAAAAYSAVSPILAAGTATAAQQKALAALDPAQRAAYTSLGALKAEFSGFSKSLEPEVLGVFNQGLKLAGGLLGDVQPVASATGKALGTVVGEIGADLKTQQWQNFFGFMAKTAGPDIQQLGSLFISLLNVLPPLLQDLQPVALEMIQVADGAARVTADIAGLPAGIDNVRQATDKWTSSIGQHLPAGNQNIFQVVSGWVDWMGKHVPGGNKSLLDLAGSAGKAATATAAAGSAAAAAAPQVGTLAGDVALLNSNTTLAADATKAFDDAWQQFAGKSVSDQQAVLNTAAAFDAYNTSLKTNKSDSVAAQQAFLAVITTIGTGLSTLQANGASVGQLNSFYQENIDKLHALHDLTPAERKDVQDVTKDYLAWANTTSGLTSQVQAASDVIRNQFLAQLGAVHASAPGVRGDISDLANAIQKTGDNSAATAADRAKLIDDLKSAGLSAGDAKQFVHDLQTAIDALHGKSVTVSLAAQAQGTLNAISHLPGQNPSTSVLQFISAASGTLVSGGTPGKDSVLAMLMPGEVVVPTAMVRGGAVDHLRGAIPGFASGGMVNLDGPGSWAAGAEGNWGTAVASMWAQASKSAFDTAAAAAAATKGNYVPGSPAYGGSVLREQQFAASLFGGYGWDPAYQMPALIALWNQESGWNPYAVNPSSGAYGIPQSLGHGQPYALGDWANQIRWGLSYIAGRYGTPQGAEAHEIAAGWYDNGGMLKPGLTLAYNGTGRPEMVVPNRGGAQQVIPAQASGRKLSADAQAIIAALEANTAAVLGQGPAVARSLNSVSAAAASRGSYSTRR